MNKNIKKLILKLKGVRQLDVDEWVHYRIDAITHDAIFENIEKVESLLDMKGAILKIAKNPGSVFDKGYISKQIRDIEDKIMEIMGE